MATEIAVSGRVVEIILHGASALADVERLEGVIDTGATAIFMDRRIAKRLGLAAVNKGQAETADGRRMGTTIYDAEMEIPTLKFRNIVPIHTLEMPASRILLGLSFLKQYIVTYNGPEEQFHYYNPVQREHDLLDDFAT